MAQRRGDGGKWNVGALQVGMGPSRGGRGAVGGSGTLATIKGIKTVTATVTPTNPIAANTVDSKTVTVAGARSGDFIIAIPPANLEAGVVVGIPQVTGNDTVTLRLSNPTGSGITTGAKSWQFLWFQLV